MSIIKDPVGRANSVKTATQAVRLRDDLEAELGLNPNLSPDWEAKADEALQIIESKGFTGEELDGLQTDREVHMSRDAQSALDPAEPKPAEPKPTSPRPGVSSSRPRARRRGGSSRAAFAGSFLGSRSFRRTGIPGGAATATGISLQAVGIFFGLTLLYLLVSDRGSKGLSTLIGGVTSAVTLLVAPVDPFAPGTLDTVSGTKAPAKKPAAKPVKHGSGAGRRPTAPAPGSFASIGALAGQATRVPARRYTGFHVPHPI